MQGITIIKAQLEDAQQVAQLVGKLLIELAPNSASEIVTMELVEVSQTLMAKEKLHAYLAYQGDSVIGVITMHECAAIYAGGIFGEISELYVEPQYRSLKIGDMLVNAAVEFAKKMHWQRIEVGTPPPEGSPRTLQFYERKGFKATGTRMRYLVE
jgi:GNAT superfamily N-acetyltransferase